MWFPSAGIHTCPIQSISKTDFGKDLVLINAATFTKDAVTWIPTKNNIFLVGTCPFTTPQEWTSLSKPLRKPKLISTFEHKVPPRSPKSLPKHCDTHDVPILLVEDNVINQKVAVQMLKNGGYSKITVAWNGIEALEKMKSQKFELVLMDCHVRCNINIDYFRCL